MYFKLQKIHQQFTEAPEPIHGLRVMRTSDHTVEAELSLYFQYDPATKLFNLFSKRLNRNSPARYDLLATAKPNTVWSFVIQSEKNRLLISAVLTDTHGTEHVVALPYRPMSPVSLQSILPVQADEPVTQVEPETDGPPQPGPVKTLIRMWYEFRDKKKKVSQARRQGT